MVLPSHAMHYHGHFKSVNAAQEVLQLLNAGSLVLLGPPTGRAASDLGRDRVGRSTRLSAIVGLHK